MLSVLVACKNGQNRSLCLLICFLMKRFNWSQFKCLEFMHYKKKDLEIGTPYYKKLDKICQEFENTHQVSSSWNQLKSLIIFREEEILITNTFLNAQKKKVVQKQQKSSSRNKEKKKLNNSLNTLNSQSEFGLTRNCKSMNKINKKSVKWFDLIEDKKSGAKKSVQYKKVRIGNVIEKQKIDTQSLRALLQNQNLIRNNKEKKQEKNKEKNHNSKAQIIFNTKANINNSKSSIKDQSTGQELIIQNQLQSNQANQLQKHQSNQLQNKLQQISQRSIKTSNIVPYLQQSNNKIGEVQKRSKVTSVDKNPNFKGQIFSKDVFNIFIDKYQTSGNQQDENFIDGKNHSYHFNNNNQQQNQPGVQQISKDQTKALQSRDSLNSRQFSLNKTGSQKVFNLQKEDHQKNTISQLNK